MSWMRKYIYNGLSTIKMERDLKPMESLFILLMVHVFAVCGANKCNVTLYTHICPKDAIEWHNRGSQFQCDALRNWTYHCILNDKGQLIEACIKKQVIAQGKGGCPWILQYNGNPFFGRPNTECPFDVDGCPQRDHREYTTDILYLYQKCFTPVGQRTVSAMTEQIDTSSTEKTSETLRSMTTINSNRKSYESPKTFDEGDPECSKTGYTVAIVLLIIVDILQLPFSIYFLMNWIKKRKKRDRNEEPHNLPDEETSMIEERKTKDQYQSSESIGSRAFVNPVDMKDSFIENDVARQIKERLENEKDKKSILLHGIRGSGKTCAALHSLRSLGKNFNVIEASNENHLRKSLKMLAEVYALNVDHSAELSHIIKMISQTLESSDIVLLIEDLIKTETLGLMNPLIEKCKCIITTHNKTISYKFQPIQTIQVCGLSVHEAKQLFEQNDMQKSYTDDELQRLVASLNGSPFGMKSVMSYMKEKNLSVGRILTYITQQTQTGVLNDDKSLFKVMGHFVSYIKSVYSEVSSLLLALQFFHCENIPIYLFYALAAYEADKCTSKNREDPYGKAEFVTNKFVSVLRHVSFGDVQGEDDGRKISVPKIVQYAVSQSTDHHERGELYHKLLKCMSWLFLKDHGHPRDHQRCLDLLPHATEIIRQFQTSTSNVSIETTLVFVQVCDQVRHTYEVLGYESEEIIYAKYITEYVSRNILKQSESEFSRTVRKDNAGTTSNNLIKLIKGIVHGKDKELSELAEDYIQFKVRSDYDITNLRKELGEHALPLTQRLSCAEISSLKKRNLIISDRNLLAYVFVYEILMSTLTVFGKYALQHDKNFETYKSFVYLTQCFAQHRMLRNYLSVRAVGIELIGIKTLRLKEHETDAPGAMQNLQASIDDVEKLRSDGRKYFKYGLYVLCPKENVDLRLRSHSVLLEYHRACKETEKASTEATALQKMFSENFRTVKAAPHSQRVKQILVEYLMENKKFENAKVILRNCQHHSPSQTISKYDCEDILLLFQCYENLMEIEDMKDLWTKVTFKIPRDEEAAKSIVKRIQDIAEKHLHKD